MALHRTAPRRTLRRRSWTSDRPRHVLLRRVRWLNVSDGFFNTAAVGALAVSDSHPNIVYAGTGEACIRSNVSHGDGVYRSDDAGRAWRNVGLAATRHISGLAIH